MSNIETAIEDRDKPRDPATGQFVAENATTEVVSDKPLDFKDDEFATELVAEFESDRSLADVLTPGDPAPTPAVDKPAVDEPAPIQPTPDAPVETPDETPDAVQPPADVTPPPGVPQVVQVGDWELPAEQVPAVRDLYEWATSLQPEQHQAINDLLSGNFYLVPRDPSGVTQPPTVPVQGSGGAGVGSPIGQPAPGSPPAPTPPVAPQPFDASEFLDPAAAAHIHNLDQRIAAMQAQQEAQFRQAQESQFRQQEQVLNAGLIAAKDEFAAKYNLDAAELEQVIARTTQLQIIPSLIPRHPGDPRAAFVSGFEAAYYSDPTFRQREIDRQAAVEAQRLTELAAKKGRASAVGAGSAPVARHEPATRPLTRDQQVDAMAQEIALAQNGNQ